MAKAELICPECGCEITGEGFEKEGEIYCCEPCATDCACVCGCLEEPDEHCR